jgi:hypothetical protein
VDLGFEGLILRILGFIDGWPGIIEGGTLLKDGNPQGRFLSIFSQCNGNNLRLSHLIS